MLEAMRTQARFHQYRTFNRAHLRIATDFWQETFRSQY
jgi:hypothetical protein